MFLYYRDDNSNLTWLFWEKNMITVNLNFISAVDRDENLDI